jgi:hypothetical protein
MTKGAKKMRGGPPGSRAVRRAFDRPRNLWVSCRAPTIGRPLGFDSEKAPEAAGVLEEGV